jgi:hypothetical protein
MAFEPVDVGTSGPAAPPESAPAQSERRDGAPNAKTPERAEPRGRLPSGDELLAKAAKAFEDARKASAAKADEAAEAAEKKAAAKPAGGDERRGHGSKPEQKKADVAPDRDRNGRFVGDEKPRASTPEGHDKAGRAPAQADRREADEAPEKAPPKPRVRDVDGRDAADPHARISDEQLADEVELDRRFAALSRQSRQARARLEQATLAASRLEEARAAWHREQEAAKSDPDRLSRRELVELAHSDPVALLEHLGADASAFNRALLQSGSDAARVDRLERQLREREAADERRRTEAEESRRRAEAEQSEAQRRQRESEREDDWGGIKQLLEADDSRPALAKAAARNFGYVRARFEALGQQIYQEVKRSNPHLSEAEIDRALTPDQRRALFARTTDRLEDELAELFGDTKPPVVIDAGGPRGGASAESGAGPRGAHRAQPEGKQTLTPRLASESSPPRFPVIKTPVQLRIEALRAFERASGGR